MRDSQGRFFNMSDDPVEKDISRNESKKLFSRRGKPIGYCESCGKAIYGIDEDGFPFRECYKCGGQ